MRPKAVEQNRTLVCVVTAADCRWDTFRAGGKGGQHQNKTETGVRCVHAPSGAVGEARDERSQLTNRRRAFRRMAESNTFQCWAKMEAMQRRGQEPSIDEIVDAQMREILVQVKNSEGEWVAMHATEGALSE